MTDKIIPVLLNELTKMGVKGLNFSASDIDFVYKDYCYHITVKAKPNK